MSARIHRLLAGASGAEIAEAALVLPLAFMVLLGIYWFGRAFNVYATINHAAREGARYAVAQTCATCSPPNAAPTINNIADQVKQAMQASGLDPSLAITDSVTHPACGGGTATCTAASGSGEPPIWYCTNVKLVAAPPPPPGSGAPVCGVTIDFQYPYQMFLPFTSLNQQPLKLSAHVQMKTEQ
jgi:Flp pilus assembly protein TadG